MICFWTWGGRGGGRRSRGKINLVEYCCERGGATFARTGHASKRCQHWLAAPNALRCSDQVHDPLTCSDPKAYTRGCGTREGRAGGRLARHHQADGPASSLGRVGMQREGEGRRAPARVG